MKGLQKEVKKEVARKELFILTSFEVSPLSTVFETKLVELHRTALCPPAWPPRSKELEVWCDIANVVIWKET